MLFIRAVNYIISQIEHHLAERLVIKNLQETSVEQVLADKLKIDVVTKIQRIQEPSSQTISNAAKPDAAKPDAAKPDAAKPDAAKPDAAKPDAGKLDAPKLDSGKSKPAKPKKAEAVKVVETKKVEKVEGSKSEGDEQKIVEKPAEKSLEEQMGDLSLNKEAAVNGSHVTTLPELLEQPIQLKDFAANSNSKNTATDDLKLRLVGSKGALTWKDFVSSSEDDFSGHLQNDLKNETLADKKMFILIRLSRQLKKLCAEAEEELSKKEKGQGISECIDTKLLKFISLRIGEAERLTEQALSASTTTYSLSRYLPEFSTKDKPGETEVILFACRNMLEEFLVFCQTENSKRKLKSMQEKGSMLDVFASKIQNLQDPLMIIDQHACDYIIENLYIDALYHGYLKFNSLPLSWKIYDPELAKTKRLKIQTSLVQYCEIAKEEKQDQNAFYDRLMSETDTLAKDLGVITPVLAYYWGKAQKSVDFCEDVHTVLRIQASSAAPTASGRHQKCFSKK